MITVGSITREEAAGVFEFLAPGFRERRTALRAFTHADPELVFWFSPDGSLLAAWDIRGRKLWSTFVEPPWGYQVIDRRVELDVMGKKSFFPIGAGRA